jgi:MoaA/NifB/PqqE/SkfB family radical SAM enzyme
MTFGEKMERFINLDLSRHNRKDTSPSKRMHPIDGQPRFCPWIQNSMTILSDGTVTCGLDDSDGLRSFGNLHNQSLKEIFSNPEYINLQNALNEGHSCKDCSLYQPLVDELPERPSLPKTLVIEPTVRCNLRCPQAACFANNSKDYVTRDKNDLPRDVLATALTELGTKLEEVYFFNYGDPFMHPEAPKMIKDIKRHSPNVKIITSTNGIPLSNKNKAIEVVEGGIDHIVFTISGMTQASYERYHVNGKLDKALQGMRNISEARRASGNNFPKITWRYLGFRWTDDYEELDAAIELGKTLNVDDFNIYLTHIPEDGWSYRLSPGTYGHALYRPWINVAFGYNRPPPPENGLFDIEDLPQFGLAQWTNWHGLLRVTNNNGKYTLWFSTNSPTAVKRGYTESYIRTPWKHLYKIKVPYCKWGEVTIRVPEEWDPKHDTFVDIFSPDSWFPADILGVEDYRCLGVLTTTEPTGTLPKVTCEIVSTNFKDYRELLSHHTLNKELTPVASGQFTNFKE